MTASKAFEFAHGKTPFLLVLFWAAHASAQVEVLPAQQPQAAFGGETKMMQVLFHNPTARSIETPLKTRLFQLSSATRMPVAEAEPWNRLTVLGGQTVLESVRLKYPDVRVTTRFEVCWLDEADKSVGRRIITVYPSNLLQQLADIAGEKPPGIFDPHEQLTPLLRTLKIEFDDLTEGERLETFRGRLVVLGPFEAGQAVPGDLQKRAANLVAHGVNVLLISPPQERKDSAVHAAAALRSTILIQRTHGHRIVIASPEIVVGLAADPLAQENLLELARLAMTKDLPVIEKGP